MIDKIFKSVNIYISESSMLYWIFYDFFDNFINFILKKCLNPQKFKDH